MEPRNGEPAGSSPVGDQPRDATDATAVGEQLLIMKREIDLLQIELAKPSAPWFKQIPVLVSIGALILSIITTLYSAHLSSEEALNDSRAELRQVVIQIDEVNQELTELETKYRTDPNALQNFRSGAYTRKLILVNQAVDTILRIDEGLTAAEYYSVGASLESLGSLDPRVFDLYRRGLALVPEPNTSIALYRSLALAYFAVNNPVEGRKSYEEALKVSAGIPSTRVLNDARTHMFWATNELSLKECGNAKRQFDAARAQIETFKKSGAVVLADYQAQLTTLEQSLMKQC